MIAVPADEQLLLSAHPADAAGSRTRPPQSLRSHRSRIGFTLLELNSEVLSRSRLDVRGLDLLVR